MKKFFNAFMACALITVILISCDSDDKEVFAPTELVTNLSFTDTDMEPGKIGGTLSWTLPISEDNVTGYVIYLSENNTNKGVKLGEVEKGKTSFEVPMNTEWNAYLLVVTKNTMGEAESFAGVSVTDEKQYTNGVFILNAGNWNENNASLSFLSFTSGQLTTDIYKAANGSGLGDGAEQLLVYGSKIYITVSGSNRLVVLDKSGKLIKDFQPKEGNAPVNPRCMVAHDGKVYVSYYYAHAVAVLDTLSLNMNAELIKVGRYPEQLTAANGKIYVVNSGGLDSPSYGNTVSVIDPVSAKVEKNIEVIANPAQIASDSQGDVYVISWADHGKTENSSLQRIDAATGKVSVLGTASTMTLVNDKIYAISNQYFNNPGLSFVVYDALTEQVVKNSFITDGTSIAPYAIAVDPQTEKIYITESEWGSTSSLYTFTADGKSEGKAIDTGGYDSKWLTISK